MHIEQSKINYRKIIRIRRRSESNLIIIIDKLHVDISFNRNNL